MYLWALECFQFSLDLHPLTFRSMVNFMRERLGAWGEGGRGEKRLQAPMSHSEHMEAMRKVFFFFPQELLCKEHLDVNKNLQYWRWRREGEEAVRNAIYHLWTLLSVSFASLHLI